MRLSCVVSACCVVSCCALLDEEALKEGRVEGERGEQVLLTSFSSNFSVFL